MDNILTSIKKRDLVHSTTAGLDIKKTTVAYIGFDATASSLHVGSLVPLMLAKNLIKHDCKVIVVLGGGTTKVGDPSGKKKERKILPDDVINKNIASLSPIFQQVLGGKVEILNNNDWLGKMDLLGWLQEVGAKVPSSILLNLESIKSRRETDSLSFLEMSYPLLQAYDFYHLNKHHNCTLQIGGSDQWGNITMGIDLVRRMNGNQVHGLTCPLLTNSQGEKMGKTEKGAVWLDSNLTKPHDFWRYWRLVRDEDVIRFLKMLTNMDLRELEYLDSNAKGAELNESKEKLATNITTMIHGEEATAAAKAAFYTISDEEKKRIIRDIKEWDDVCETAHDEVKRKANKKANHEAVKKADESGTSGAAWDEARNKAYQEYWLAAWDEALSEVSEEYWDEAPPKPTKSKETDTDSDDETEPLEPLPGPLNSAFNEPRKRLEEMMEKKGGILLNGIKPRWGECRHPWDIIKELGWRSSGNQARQAVEEGLARIDGEVVKDPWKEIPVYLPSYKLVELGKKRTALVIKLEAKNESLDA